MIYQIGGSWVFPWSPFKAAPSPLEPPCVCMCVHRIYKVCTPCSRALGKCNDVLEMRLPPALNPLHFKDRITEQNPGLTQVKNKNLLSGVHRAPRPLPLTALGLPQPQAMFSFTFNVWLLPTSSFSRNIRARSPFPPRVYRKTPDSSPPLQAGQVATDNPVWAGMVASERSDRGHSFSLRVC